MVMFYGQAFRNVHDAVTMYGPTDVSYAKVLHECVCGLAIHSA